MALSRQAIGRLVCIPLLLLLVLHFQSEISSLRRERQILVEHVDRVSGRSDAGRASERGDGDDDDDLVLLYNRVPKTGSTSFTNIAYSLCKKLGYNVLHINTTRNSPILSLSDQGRFIKNVTNWNSKKPALYHGHVAYLDFRRFGASNPLYINIIRKPLDRLISYYYFLRYGDNFRPHLRRGRQGDTMTFDECVRLDKSDCDPSNLWLQIPFFCGQYKQCWEVGNEWALDQAKRNLVNNYLIVGVTEEIADFISLLEFALPRFFSGATTTYLNGKRSHLRKTSNKTVPLPATMKKMKRSKVWQLENEFYSFAYNHFQYVKRRSLVEGGGGKGRLVDKGTQFHYEKIKPD